MSNCTLTSPSRKGKRRVTQLGALIGNDDAGEARDLGPTYWRVDGGPKEHPHGVDFVVQVDFGGRRVTILPVSEILAELDGVV